MDISAEVLAAIGQPESETLEYKAVLPPAATLARFISSFANVEGGLLVLGVSDDGAPRVHGLSDEFRAVEIVKKALDLLSPRPDVFYQYVDYSGVRLFAIKVARSIEPVYYGERTYVRRGVESVPKQEPARTVAQDAEILELLAMLRLARAVSTAAKSQLLDHYESVLAILDSMKALVFPNSKEEPASSPQGKILTRIMFSSCADNFETYLSDLLLEIYLARPETLISESSITVREVLECADMQEFISAYARKKLSKLQRGSVKGFIVENKQIRALGVLDIAMQAEIEKVLQIRHLFAHRNGIVDAKFQSYFSSAALHTDFEISMRDVLAKLELLVRAAEAIDEAAIREYGLGNSG